MFIFLILFLGSQSGFILDKKSKKRRSPRNRTSQDDLRNVSDSETTSKPPPPPPLPFGYSQSFYPYDPHENSSLKMQKKLSRSVGAGLQDQQNILRAKIFSSAGDLLDKSHEELVLLLIQLRRNQAQMYQKTEQLRLQMESEEKMMEIEPQYREDHKARYEELRKNLIALERDYESQFPVIDMVNNMVKLNHPIPTANRVYGDNNSYSYTDDFEFKKAKAASTSFLNQFTKANDSRSMSSLHQPPAVPVRSEQFSMTKYLSPPKRSENANETEEMQNSSKNIRPNEERVERTLEEVRSSLHNISINKGDESGNTVTHNVEKTTRRSDQNADDNSKIDSDVMIPRSKINQIISSPATSSSSSSLSTSKQDDHTPNLAAQLANIDQAIDSLTAKRNKILENFKKQHLSDPNLAQTQEENYSSLSRANKSFRDHSNAKSKTDVMDGKQITSAYSYNNHVLSDNNHVEKGSEVHLYENLGDNLINHEVLSSHRNGLTIKYDGQDQYRYKYQQQQQQNLTGMDMNVAGIGVGGGDGISNNNTVRSMKKESKKLKQSNQASYLERSDMYRQEYEYGSEDKDSCSEANSDVNMNKTGDSKEVR